MSTSARRSRYATMQKERQDHVDAVLASSAPRKIVVAGPGTGKTYLFQKILTGQQRTLTLTFVNALVDDLALKFSGLSEVKTLHAFARQQLQKARGGEDVKVFPHLPTVMSEDAGVLLSRHVDFEAMFHDKVALNESLEFYRDRRKYYGGHYGFSDMVYAAVMVFERNRDSIPEYSQVLVDEFQDFNALEVSLIDLLGSRSPLLLAGDDDQALYAAFKGGSTQYIRERDLSPDYERFRLPYCSRCTRVIVDAANDLISRARQVGALKDRIDKPLRYFESREKDEDSARNPSVLHGSCYPNQIPWFIQTQIEMLARQVRENFSVLVIAPYAKQLRAIVTALREKGFHNVHYVKREGIRKPTLLDGLTLLLEDSKSNLGWRVAAKALLSASDFQSVLSETAEPTTAKPLHKILPREPKAEVKALLKSLRDVRHNKRPADIEDINELLELVEVDPLALATKSLRNRLPPVRQKRPVDHGIRKIPIRATTILSSKGLQADYVFIAHFDDRYFIRNADNTTVSDDNICSFLVALTRAQRRVFLVSSDKTRTPTFLQWIKPTRVEQV